MDIDALFWAAVRAFVQLTWFLNSLLLGSRIGNKASSLASVCIYSLYVVCVHTLERGIPPQALVSVYNPGTRSAVVRIDLIKSHTNLKETVNVLVFDCPFVLFVCFFVLFLENVTAKHNLYKTSLPTTYSLCRCSGTSLPCQSGFAGERIDAV